MFKALCLVALLLQLPHSPDATVEDLRVIDAALSHKARLAPAPPSTPLLLIDRTLPVCKANGSSINCVPVDGRRLSFIQKRMPELTEAGMRALAARNAAVHL